MSSQRDLFGPIPVPLRRRVGGRIYLATAVRAHAEELRRHGASVAEIGQELGIGATTVRARLGRELERGMPGGRRAGRPQWSPTDAHRSDVERMAAEGVSLETIARILSVSAPTIRVHCADELARGRRAHADRAAIAVRAVQDRAASAGVRPPNAADDG